MQTNIFQCCYTNATREAGGTVSSGWQTVCVSENIPGNAYAACEKLQNVNASMRGETVDEQGRPLNLFELTGDGSFLYVCRTQYGLVDRVGRANMFSHAYILPCREAGFIDDPNHYLTIARSSFKASEAEAAQGVDGIQYRPPFDLEDALQQCGISDEAFAVLIRCVYIQYTEKGSMGPLFVQYGGSEEEMMNLLFCIYSALPLYMRRNLRVASAVMGSGRNIVFSTHAADQPLYVLPKTGENNVLTDRSNAKLDRAAFVDYVARSHTTLDEPDYFRSLEEKVVSLGDPSGANERLLKIAHQMLEEADLSACSYDRLVAMLSGALSVSILGNANLDQFIARLMDQVSARQMELTPELESLLADQENASAAPELPEAILQYRFALFCKKPVADVARQLSSLPPQVSELYFRKLRESDKGLEILNEYYTAIVLREQEPGWDLLRKVLDDTQSLGDRKRIVETVDRMAWDLYCEEIDKKQNVSGFDITAILSEYMSVMTRLLPPKDVSGCEESAKDEFWNRIHYSAISFAAEDQYRRMRNDSEKCRLFLAACDLRNTYGEVKPVQFLREAYRFFSANRDEFGKEQEILQRNLLSAVPLEREADRDISTWYQTVLAMPNEEKAEDVITMYAALNERNYRVLSESFDSAILESAASESAKARCTQMLIRLCRQLDDRKPVPVDLWLKMSRKAYGRSCDVFDRVHPKALDMDPVQLVESSSLLATEPYMTEAEAYVKEKGKEGKTVKRWVSVIAERSKPQGGILQNILGGLPFFGKRSREDTAPNETERTERYHAEAPKPEARGRGGDKAKGASSRKAANTDRSSWRKKK